MSVAPTAISCPPVVCPSLGGGSILKGASDRAAASVMTAFSGWVVKGATWLVLHAIELVVEPTVPDLDARWFRHREGSMLQIAVLLVGPLLAAATIGAVVRQDGRRLVRVWAVGLPIGILCASTAIAFTKLALKVVNRLCDLVTPGTDPYGSIRGLGGALGDHGAPAFVQFIIASIMVLAAIVLWMELVLRSAVLYIAAFFLPLGLAAFIWPATAHITKRFVELIVAVIGSKFVIVATLTLGSAALGKDDTIDGVVTGTAVLLLAAFAPYSLLKLVPLVEAAAIAHLEGTSRRPAQAAGAVGGRAVSSGRRMAGSVAGLMAGSEGGLESEGVGAVDIGERIGDWAPADTASGDGRSVSPGGPDSSAGDPGAASAGGGSPADDGGGGGAVDGGGRGPVAAERVPGGPVGSEGMVGSPSPRSPQVPASAPLSSATAGAWGEPEVGPMQDAVPDPNALLAPVVDAPPLGVPGSGGPDLDGWSDDE